MTQETRFVRTGAELQKFIDEIAFLSRSEMPVDEYLRRFLQVTIVAVGGQGGALWFPQGAEFQRACSSKFTDCEYDNDDVQRKSIQNALSDVTQNRRPLVVGPFDPEGALHDPKDNGIINHTAYPFFFVPILVGESSGQSQAAGVLHVWVGASVDPKSYKDFVSFLQLAVGQASVFLRARRLESLASSTEKMQQLLRFVSELNGQIDMVTLAITIVNWGREVIGCDRCALLGKKPSGKLKTLAISNAEVVDEKSELVRSMMELVEMTLQSGTPTLYRRSSPKAQEVKEIGDYFDNSHSSEALVIPLTGREEKIIGALVVEGQKDQPIDESLQKLSAAVATQGGRALAAAQELEFLPLAKQLRWLEKMRDKLYGDEGKAMLARWGLPAAGVVLLACLPWRLSVSGDCVVRPVKRAEVAAEVPGRIVQVFVTEGQTVTNGQALAQLDDAESQQSLKMAEQEKLKSETEADRLQMLGDDGGRRLSLINAARTERQIEQLKERIGKARLRSPIHGVILTKDLQARLGDFLQVGAAFCAVADLSRWEVETRVKESEILLVDRALRKGKEIPLSFLLYGLPNDDMRGIVRGLDSVSQISYQVPQANVFMVRADVDVPARLQQELKTGYSGRGRMAVGWRPVIWVAIRKFVNYVHVRWLF